MIISVDDVKKYITTTEPDAMLEMKLKALEQLIRSYTNNNFQKRAHRVEADIIGGIFMSESLIPFKEGDTVEVSNAPLNNGLYIVTSAQDTVFTVAEEALNELDVLVTKVEYPADVVMGVVNMLKWDLENRAKVGIQSETISRHSVTYFNMDADNSVMGYPKSLLGFLKPYRRARF